VLLFYAIGSVLIIAMFIIGIGPLGSKCGQANYMGMSETTYGEILQLRNIDGEVIAPGDNR